jgi:hypothetical protein
MNDDDFAPQPPRHRLSWFGPIIGIVCAALVLVMYFSGPSNGALPAVISISFLCILPATVCFVLASAIDYNGTRSRSFYAMLPFWIALAAILIGAIVLREGVICILMLTPPWLLSGWVGTWIAYRVKHRDGDRYYSSAVLLLPLLAAQIEAHVPAPQSEASVTRSISVDAKPQDIWPALKGIPDVRAGEGRWNVTQDVFGVPRPHGARLIGSGLGADRQADWGRNIRFRERITNWQPDKSIGWQFIFDDVSGWAFTDRHLMPDSPYFRVTSGGYTLKPLADGRTEVTLTTRYWIKTPLNTYAGLWGEFLLGDLENNLLALIKARSEAGWTDGAA